MDHPLLHQLAPIAGIVANLLLIAVALYLRRWRDPATVLLLVVAFSLWALENVSFVLASRGEAIHSASLLSPAASVLLLAAFVSYLCGSRLPKPSQ